ncbi:MAG: ABC transporter ATP-binding protein [bacterium]|nr:ABC transporter ATP-binding protein [bacterium]
MDWQSKTHFFSVSNLSVKYGGICAVNQISLDVSEGEIVALLGANGAGKSSTLSAITGTCTIASGEIWFLGERIDTLLPSDRVRKGIVLCPEGRRIFPHLTVLENLYAGAFLQKNTLHIENQLQKVYQLFPVLAQRSTQSGRTLSGGEQQMLAIGRALMSFPKLLLLDEPSLGLAPVVAQKIFQTIHELRTIGVSMLLVEQNAKAALELADRAYVLETGKIVKSGHCSELKNDPAIQSAYLGG